MRFNRIYYPFSEKLHELLIIQGDRAHYMRNVLRLKTGRKIKIFNNHQQEYLAEIKYITKKDLTLELLEEINGIAPSKLEITLIQSLSKGERMDYTVQKATELGITQIIPITSEYCEVKLTGNRLEKKLNHWNNIAISACEQSFRKDIPKIFAPISLIEYAKKQHQGILLEPEEKQTIKDIAKLKWQKFEIVIGPEGGWSSNDLKLLRTTGLTGIQFGQRILRTETVAPAILAAIHSLWGDFV